MTDPTPTAEELLEAVREFLADEVVPALDGYARYQARVAVNLVTVLEREWRLASGHAAAHAERLHRFGVDDDRELAAAIRAGDLDDRQSELLAALREAARDRLDVVNPGWAPRR